MKNPRISGSEVRLAMQRAGITAVPAFERPCCGGDARWLRFDDNLFFDAGCSCGFVTSGVTPRHWSSLASWIGDSNAPGEFERRALLCGFVFDEEPDEPEDVPGQDDASLDASGCDVCLGCKRIQADGADRTGDDGSEPCPNCD